jgi:hypothetical protein
MPCIFNTTRNWDHLVAIVESTSGGATSKSLGPDRGVQLRHAGGISELSCPNEDLLWLDVHVLDVHVLDGEGGYKVQRFCETCEELQYRHRTFAGISRSIRC